MLSKAEKRYAQIVKEALAIAGARGASTRFYNYLVGLRFTIKSVTHPAPKKTQVQAQLIHMSGPPPLSITAVNNGAKKKTTPTKKQTTTKSNGDESKRSSSKKRPVPEETETIIVPSDHSGEERLSLSQNSDSSAKRHRNAKNLAGDKIRESLTPHPLPTAQPYEYDLKVHHKGGKNRKKNEAERRAREKEIREAELAATAIQQRESSSLDFQMVLSTSTPSERN